MFKTGGTSAYGKGITSNLVSDEQRQRFNSGGRVGLLIGGDYSKWFDPNAYAVARQRNYQKLYEPSFEGPNIVDRPDLRLGEGDAPYKHNLNWLKTQADTADDKPFIEDISITEDIPVKKEEPDYTTGEHWDDLPSKMPSEQQVIRDDTDDLDTPDKWAFLDEQQKAKQKLARGYGLTEAAAAAAKWSTAGTAKERSAAISEGLSKVGAIGAKFTGEAEDLKTKAQILGTVEEIKGEQKQKLWQDRLKGYYQPTLDIAAQGLALKKAAVELAAEGKDGLSIYDDILLTNSKSLRDPFTKRDILRSLTGKNLQVEGEKNKKTLNSKENEGLIFIDIRGNVVRNKGDGTTEGVDETRDEFFTWRN
jgi:hypothetical protein